MPGFRVRSRRTSHTVQPVLTRLGPSVVLVVLATVTTSPAYADQWRSSDHHRDVVSYRHDPDPAPCGTTTVKHHRKDKATDITALAVRHPDARVVIVVRFRDLRRQSEQVTSIALRTDRKTYELDIDRGHEGRTVVFLSAWRPPEHVGECGAYTTDALGIPCDGMEGTISPTLDRVTARVPRRCVGTPRWVRAGVNTSRTLSSGTRYDHWEAPGATLVDYLGWLGPRVRHSAPVDAAVGS